MQFTQGRARHCAPLRYSWPNKSRARSTSIAVIAVPKVNPNCVAVMATLGRIPASTVWPPMRPIICAVSATVRAKKESSVSTAETSSTTPRAPNCSSATSTLSCSAATVGSSGSAGIVTISTSRTLITDRPSSMINYPFSRTHCSAWKLAAAHMSVPCGSLFGGTEAGIDGPFLARTVTPAKSNATRSPAVSEDRVTIPLRSTPKCTIV